MDSNFFNPFGGQGFGDLNNMLSNIPGFNGMQSPNNQGTPQQGALPNSGSYQAPYLNPAGGGSMMPAGQNAGYVDGNTVGSPGGMPSFAGANGSYNSGGPSSQSQRAYTMSQGGQQQQESIEFSGSFNRSFGGNFGNLSSGIADQQQQGPQRLPPQPIFQEPGMRVNQAPPQQEQSSSYSSNFDAASGYNAALQQQQLQQAMTGRPMPGPLEMQPYGMPQQNTGNVQREEESLKMDLELNISITAEMIQSGQVSEADVVYLQVLCPDDEDLWRIVPRGRKREALLIFCRPTRVLASCTVRQLMDALYESPHIFPRGRRSRPRYLFQIKILPHMADVRPGDDCADCLRRMKYDHVRTGSTTLRELGWDKRRRIQLDMTEEGNQYEENLLRSWRRS